MITAGVIAVQGDVSEHVTALERAGASQELSVAVREIRQAGIVPECDVLVLPGGESTTISRLLDREGIDDEIQRHVAAGKPVLATCAGLIVASRDANDERVATLDLMDIAVTRNAFGRQVESFEASVNVSGLDSPFHAVFIRAPIVTGVGSDVRILAEWDGHPVAVQDGPVIGTAFHPELVDDSRLHTLTLFDPLAATQ